MEKYQVVFNWKCFIPGQIGEKTVYKTVITGLGGVVWVVFGVMKSIKVVLFIYGSIIHEKIQCFDIFVKKSVSSSSVSKI